MSKVIDAPGTGNAAPSPAPEQQVPSIEERVNTLTPDQRMHYRKTGELPELAPPKPDDKADLSPAPQDPPENEPASAPGEPQPESADTEKSRKRRERNAQRWDELLEERGALRRENELLRKQIAEGAAKPTPAEEKPSTSDRPKRPRLKDFDDIDAYESAMDTYEDAKEAWDAKQYESRQSQAESRREQSQRQQSWEEQVKAEEAINKDFRKVAFNENAPASDVMISVMRGHKVGAKIAYYLGQHPDEAAEIAEASELPPHFAQLQKSNPVQAAFILGEATANVKREFNRIADAIAKPPAAKPETKPNLPKPSSEVTVQANAQPVADEEEDAIKRGDTEAYKRIVNRKEIEARKGGRR